MKLVLNRRGIEDVLKSDGVKAHDRKIAERAAETTRRLVPSRDRGNVKVVETDDGAAVVVDSSMYHWWEWGNRNTPARAPLRNGLESVGLKTKGQ